MIEEEFRTNKLINYELDDEFAKNTFAKNNINSLEDIYLEVAKSNLSPKTVYLKYIDDGDGARLTEENLQKQIEKNNKTIASNSETGVIVEGLNNPMLKLGSCCNPIPGDPIMGYVTKGYGIVVHHCQCKNAINFEKERIIEVKWADGISRKYPVSIKIEATSNMNLLVEIMNTVSQSGMSILAIHASTNNNLETIVKLKVSTTNTIDLEKMIINLKKVKYIYNIERENI